MNTDEGGGISLFNTELTISRTTIAGNSAEREGGGIVASTSELRVKNSTISRNRAFERGGGLYLSEGATRIVNSTITQNRTRQDGGGIVVLGAGELDLNAVTIARNLANSDSAPFSETGGGLSNDTTGPVEVRNSVIALNRLGPGVRNDCTGNPITSGGGNLLSTLGPADVCTGFDGPGDACARIRGSRSSGRTAGRRRRSRSSGQPGDRAGPSPPPRPRSARGEAGSRSRQRRVRALSGHRAGAEPGAETLDSGPKTGVSPAGRLPPPIPTEGNDA